MFCAELMRVAVFLPICSMEIKDFFTAAIAINAMEDNAQKELAACRLFEELNAFEIPRSFNWVRDVFEELHVKQRGEHRALLWEDFSTGDVQIFTYEALSVRCNQYLNAFRRAGVEKGDNLYMMIPLIPENWVLSLTCLKGGFVAIPTAMSMTLRELSFRFGSYLPQSIITEEAYADMVDAALKEVDHLPKLKILVSGKREGWVSASEFVNESTEAEAADTESSDSVFCFFTSGTTGLPKKVAHTAASYPIGHLSTAIMVGTRADDIHHNLSAPGWGKWAWSSFFVPFSVGATVASFNFKRLNVSQYLSALERHRVSVFCAPPTAWRMLVNAKLADYDLSSLRYSLGAGEPLNPELITKWKKFTGTEIRDFYGQTESTAMIGNPPWSLGKMKSGSFGQPAPMYDIVLLDEDGEVITTPDTPGHIAVNLKRWRPVGLFSDYMDDSEMLESVMLNGHYLTGDRASFDTDGFWWFIGRADDVIKSSDFRIGPFEVESALMESPAVKEVAVIGVPDEKRHNLVKAFIILNENYQSSRELASELFEHCVRVLAKFKIPRIIEFVEEVPKTISGKIRRVELRDREEKKINGMKMEERQEFFYR